MIYKKLGSSNLDISCLGLGCMGMSEFYGSTNDAESIEVIRYAITNGMNFLDTADQYGIGHNEELIGKAIKGIPRDKVVIATKFGVKRDPNDPKARIICGTPEYAKIACETSLKRLDVDYIDLYYIHRIDVSTPLEETMNALSTLVKEGKIRYIGLSETSADTIARAHKVHPISAVQTEYSLWSRDAEENIIPFCKVNNISFTAYSPLGRGFLTGKISSTNDLEANDFRRLQPRFNEENFAHNMSLVHQLESIAQKNNITSAQLALSWILHQDDHIIPIPGTKKMKWLIDNIQAANIDLSTADIDKLNTIFTKDSVSGNRYNDAGMRLVNL